MALVACKRVRAQNICPADVRCLLHLCEKSLKGTRMKILQSFIVECGECHGNSILTAWNVERGPSALGETVDVIHTGICISAFCRQR